MTNQNLFNFDTGVYKLTYFAIVSEKGFDAYYGRIKIGDTTYHTDKTIDEILSEAKAYHPDLFAQGIITTLEIEEAGKKRIHEWAGTGDLPAVQIFAALNLISINETLDSGKVVTHYETFRDYDVHNVLHRSGFQKRFFRHNKTQGEWFTVSEENALKAFVATTRKEAIFKEAGYVKIPLILRNEQKSLIKFGKKRLLNAHVENPKKILCNAIMRFGKTITTYSLIEEMRKIKPEKLQKTLILTHRPIVVHGWNEDFYKVFGKDSEWQFGSKNTKYGVSYENLDKTRPYVYFASIQDMRGSFGDNNDANTDTNLELILSKNKEIFEQDWDMIVIDESHEGTGTELAHRVLSNLRSARQLHLSGTPYNISKNFDDDEIFNWTYIDERKALIQWQKDVKTVQEWKKNDKNTSAPFSDEKMQELEGHNPYEGLPEIEIRTIDLTRIMNNKDILQSVNKDGVVGFNFNKFFAIDKNSTKINTSDGSEEYHPFENPEMIAEFLIKVFENDQYRPADQRKLFPFGDANSKKLFAHTLWMLPSVDASIALKAMLNEMYPEFYVVNATGDNDSGDALADVQKAIKEHERTITLSVGKLTVGTTVSEWNGILLLNNMKSPMNYMQTSFRVKSAGTLYNGKMKQTGYVFDFAPNRTLEMISEVAKQTPRHNTKLINDVFADEEGNVLGTNEEYAYVEELLTYMPVIAYDGVRMRKADTNEIMQKIHQINIRNAVNSGFESWKLYTIDLHDFSAQDRLIIDSLKTINKLSGYEKTKNVVINESSLTQDMKETLKKAKYDKDSVDKKELSEAEKAYKEDLKNAQNIRYVLTGVMVRVPLLVMASDIKYDVTLENFPTLIDDESWIEFMPKGFTKDMWFTLIKFLNKAVFEGACKEIRMRVQKMSKMDPLQRVIYMANLFMIFKNPDKETILTPWRVVNLQLANTLGGYRWVDNKGHWYCQDKNAYSWGDIEESDGLLVPTPIKVSQGDVDEIWEKNNSTFYDINSKTALYLLFATATVFKKRLDKVTDALGYAPGLEAQNEMWNKIVEEQIFVNVRVPYSKKIAQRVLLGYNKDIEINASVVDVISVRNLLKDMKFIPNDSVRERKLSNDELNKLIGWVLLGVKDKGFMSVDERLKMLDKDMAGALDLANADDEKFTAVLSNPPYQISNEGNNHQVYGDFYIIGRIVGIKLSMIFPLGWQTSSGQGTGSTYHKSMRDDKSMVSVDNYYENKNSPILVFPEAGTGGVSIVFADSSRSDSNTVIFYEYGISVDENKDLTKVVYWSDKTQKIFESIHSVLSTGTMDSKISGRAYFGLYGYFTTDPKRNEYALVSSDYFNNSIKFWSRNKNDSRYSWWYISNDLISKKINQKDASSWKVVWPKSGAWANHRRSMVFKPDELFSDTFICAFFDSKDHANNFQTYFRTLFYRFIISETAADQNAYAGVHRYVPDLSTIQNPRTGKIGWESDWTDEDLKILFKDVLTDEDWEYIEKTALESDGGRK